MKKQKMIIMIIIIISIITYLLLFSVGNRATGIIIVGIIERLLDENTASEQLRQEQRDEVELFFKKNGYEIDIIGAYTNGREHGGPFLYGWYWQSFEIGSDVILLYPYHEMQEINGYLDNLDDKTRNKCHISKNFVFYYSGRDENINRLIIEFCESGR